MPISTFSFSRFSFAPLAVASAVLLGTASLSAAAADDAFVKKASAGGATEVTAGNLAKTQGSSDKVKQFGNMMVTDHTKAGDELKSIAAGKKMNPSSSPDKTGETALASLKAKTDTGFDKAYKAQMIKDHNHRPVSERSSVRQGCRVESLCRQNVA